MHGCISQPCFTHYHYNCAYIYTLFFFFARKPLQSQERNNWRRKLLRKFRKNPLVQCSPFSLRQHLVLSLVASYATGMGNPDAQHISAMRWGSPSLKGSQLFLSHVQENTFCRGRSTFLGKRQDILGCQWWHTACGWPCNAHTRWELSAVKRRHISPLWGQSTNGAYKLLMFVAYATFYLFLQN